MNGIALGKPDLTKEIEPASAYTKLSGLFLPTYVMWGELDFPHVKTRCQYLVDNIPDAKVKKYPVQRTCRIWNNPQYSTNYYVLF